MSTRLHPAIKRGEVLASSPTLSSQIIADVRDALFARSSSPATCSAPRMRSRRATASAGSWRGMRCARSRRLASPRSGWGRAAAPSVARGNPRLFAEVLAVQLDLIGVGAAEIMDAQRAIECLAAELAAENATEADIAKLRQLLDEAEANIDNFDRYTPLSRDFHLAVAEASHNRVLVVQLISLQHVSWPTQNSTLTPKVARRVLDIHKELAEPDRDARSAGARRLMDDHVKMIRARRVAEQGKSEMNRSMNISCC